MSGNDETSKPSIDDDYILIEDEATVLLPLQGEREWLVLVVDDDPDVHQSTEFALRGMEVEGRSLRLLHAHSAAEARQCIVEIDDLAVLLLDVVMESEDAGLKLVEHVRRDLRRKALRIVLRTGQPGYAPEQETIRDYDINDYKTKSELTRIRLYTMLTTAVRAYRQMRAHEDMRRGLETVVRASTELTKLRGMQLFAQGVVGQLCALLDVKPAGLICAQEAHPGDLMSARVIAAAGHFQHLIQRPLEELEVAEIQRSLKACLAERRSHFGPTLTLYFASESGCGLAAYVEVQRELDELDRHLLEVFCASMAVGFENVQLYARLVDQAYVDPLLKVPNLNRLLEVLDQAQSASGDLTLALLDVGMRTKTWTGYAAMPTCRRCCAGLRKPSELLIRTSLYQRMYASNAAMNSSMLVESQLRAKNISVLSRPEKPSHAALSGEHPLRDIERTSLASEIRASQPGHR